MVLSVEAIQLFGDGAFGKALDWIKSLGEIPMIKS